MGFEVNSLNALMLVIVSFVSLLVAYIRIGYMKDDARKSVFFSYIALFTFSMLALVISENIVQLYIFWELVGVCSFLLIGFWYATPAAKAAAKKAFIVTRIGDVGLVYCDFVPRLACSGPRARLYEYRECLRQQEISMAAWRH